MRLCAIAASVLLATGCATAPTVTVEYDEARDFAAYETFAWIGEEALSGSGSRALPASVADAFEAAIRKELQAKGFVEVEDPAAADLGVKALYGLRENVVFDSAGGSVYGPSDVAVAGVNRAGVRRDSVVVARSGTQEYTYDPMARTVNEATLVVEIVELASGDLVWNASAQRDVTNAPMDGSNAERAMREFLRAFPPSAP